MPQPHVLNVALFPSQSIKWENFIGEMTWMDDQELNGWLVPNTSNATFTFTILSVFALEYKNKPGRAHDSNIP